MYFTIYTEERGHLIRFRESAENVSDMQGELQVELGSDARIYWNWEFADPFI